MRYGGGGMSLTRLDTRRQNDAGAGTLLCQPRRFHLSCAYNTKRARS